MYTEGSAAEVILYAIHPLDAAKAALVAMFKKDRWRHCWAAPGDVVEVD